MEEILEKTEDVHLVHPEVDKLVQSILDTKDAASITALKEEFGQTCSFSLTNTDSENLFSHLWDYFFDWCMFEKNLPDEIRELSNEDKEIWQRIRTDNVRSLFIVKSVDLDNLKLKDQFGRQSYHVLRNTEGNFLGIHKGDYLECRLVESVGEKKKYRLVRRPSFHLPEVAPYLKTKIKHFKKTKDETGFQAWLWELVGMSLKHQIYEHMPITKIYDDNSRI